MFPAFLVLAFAYIPTEVAVALRLRPGDALYAPSEYALAFPHILWDAMLGTHVGLVGQLCDWEEVVYLHIGIAAGQRNSHAGGSSV